MKNLSWTKTTKHGRTLWSADGDIRDYTVFDGTLHTHAHAGYGGGFIHGTRRAIKGTLTVCKARALFLENLPIKEPGR